MRAVYGMILLAISSVTLTAQADHWSDLKSVSYAYVSSVEHFREELEARQAHPYVVQTAYRLERDARDLYNMSRGRCDVDRLLFTHREVIDGHRRMIDVVNQSCRSDRHLMRDFEVMDVRFNELNDVIQCIQRAGVSPYPGHNPGWSTNRPTYPPVYGGSFGSVNPYGSYPSTTPNWNVPGYGPNVPAVRPVSPHDMFRSMHYEMMRAMMERNRR